MSSQSNILTLHKVCSPSYRVPQTQHPEVSEGPGAGAGQTLTPVPGTKAPRVIIIIIIIIMVIFIMTRQLARAGYQGQVTASLHEGGTQG